MEERRAPSTLNRSLNVERKEGDSVVAELAYKTVTGTSRTIFRDVLRDRVHDLLQAGYQLAALKRAEIV